MLEGRYAVVILAAGYSRRMEQFKPLLPLGGLALIERVAASFRYHGVAVHLVVGWRGQEIIDCIKEQDINIIDNSAYDQGMFTSVQAGVRALSPATEAFFIMPVDIPLVRPATIGRLLHEADKYPDRIVYPVFGKKRGHPPLLPAELAPEILAWSGEGGLRAVLGKREEKAHEVIVPDGNILFDIDNHEDYQAAQERFRLLDIPTDEECRVIIEDICRVAPGTRQHGDKVAEVAVNIGRSLCNCGRPVNIGLVQAAARLHDIAKGQSRHDAAGGRMLRDMGFEAVGNIVAVHTHLDGDNGYISLEAKVVYLADKFVKGRRIVTLDERYQSADSKYADTPEIEGIIQRRKARAKQVKREFEDLLGTPLEKLIVPQTALSGKQRNSD